MAGNPEPDLAELQAAHRRLATQTYILYAVSILAIVAVTYGLTRVASTEGDVERIVERIIRIERPSDATLKRELARALVVCSRDPDCRRRFASSALRGPRGESGAAGQSLRGAPGAPGSSIRGARGATGTSREGRRGAPGGRGATGGSGASGERGEPGREGAEGPPGSEGSPGRDGKDGRDGEDARDRRDRARERVDDVLDDVLDRLPLP
jgi:uncharacterized membrane protein YgcG